MFILDEYLYLLVILIRRVRFSHAFDYPGKIFYLKRRARNVTQN